VAVALQAVALQAQAVPAQALQAQALQAQALQAQALRAEASLAWAGVLPVEARLLLARRLPHGPALERQLQALPSAPLPWALPR
jgi:hypothetical protein